MSHRQRSLSRGKEDHVGKRVDLSNTHTDFICHILVCSIYFINRKLMVISNLGVSHEVQPVVSEQQDCPENLSQVPCMSV